jgi:hypothetical protein
MLPVPTMKESLRRSMDMSIKDSPQSGSRPESPALAPSTGSATLQRLAKATITNLHIAMLTAAPPHLPRKKTGTLLPIFITYHTSLHEHGKSSGLGSVSSMTRIIGSPQSRLLGWRNLSNHTISFGWKTRHRAEDQESVRLIRQNSTTPLATGEVFNSVFDYQTLITERLIDYVRSSVTHAGGITSMKKILDFAAIYGIRSGMHGPTDISPIGMAANLHLGLAIHNFGIQEYMPHNATTLDVFYDFLCVRSRVHPPRGNSRTRGRTRRG